MGVLYEVGSGGGHTMSPTPSPSVNENGEQGAGVVATVNAAVNTNDEVASLFGVQRWSNESTKRLVVSGSATNSLIGSSGIGTWPDEDANVTEVISPAGDPSAQNFYEISFPAPGSTSPAVYVLTSDTTVQPNKKYFTSTKIIDESDWLPWEMLKVVDKLNPDSGMGTDNIDIDIKFDPSAGEPVTLGGYIVDTDTGNICIKFGNSISDTENAKIAIDLTYTRNDVSYIS